MAWQEIKRLRRRLAREQGTVIKDWGGRLPVALVYPNSYYVGMSNLGLHTLYRLLNSDDRVVAERFFWEGDRRLPLLSLESQRPLSDFAVLAFSLSYELDYFNAVSLLRAGGLPVSAAERDERHPLVIGGGPTVTANPVPLAPFFDCLAIGEAEPLLPGMLSLIKRAGGEKREDTLAALAGLPGVYAPRLFSGRPVRRQWAQDLDDFPVASAVLTPDTELGDLFLIEVERGCNWGCRFCLTGRAFSPMRCRSLESIVAQAEEGLKHRRRLGLVGAAVADHPQIEALLTRLEAMGAALSVSSLRVAPLSTPVLRALAGGGGQSVALAPEAGSQRLRDGLNKNVTEDDVLRAVTEVARLGLRQVKLYFMVGLPGEITADIEEMIDLTLRCKAILDGGQTGCRLTLNVSPFVPKAGTPFQRQPMASLAVLGERLSRLKKALVPRGVRVKGESPAWSQVQGVLARGDARVGQAIAAVGELSLAGWRRAVETCQLDIDAYLYRGWETGARLPWDVRDLGQGGPFNAGRAAR